MDRDFHFGATYNAAVLAGFSKGEAEIIAHAAQYVDHFSSSDYEEVKKRMKPGKGAAQTVQETSALTAHTLANWSGVDRYTAAIWPVFHFLPGNYERDDLLDTGDADAALSPLICRPYGPLDQVLLDRAQKKWTDYAVPAGDGEKTLGALIRIGITMHVLADTFAHANFVGLPSEKLNEVRNIANEDNAGNKLWIFPMRDYAPTFASSGYGYLGHGRIGHLPDEAWRHYSYQPAWSETRIERDNPRIFTEAFLYLYTALKYIRGEGAAPRNGAELDCPPDDTQITVDFVEKGLNSVAAQEEAWAALNAGMAYKRPTIKKDEAFLLSFGRQAWHHRDLVLEHCKPLRNLLDSNRITG